MIDPSTATLKVMLVLRSAEQVAILHQQEERMQQLMQVEAAARLLSDRVGSASTDFELSIANQDGTQIELPETDRRGFALGTLLHAKGKVVPSYPLGGSPAPACSEFTPLRPHFTHLIAAFTSQMMLEKCSHSTLFRLSALPGSENTQDRAGVAAMMVGVREVSALQSTDLVGNDGKAEGESRQLMQQAAGLFEQEIMAWDWHGIGMGLAWD
jgi:hypothetical protein